eukprot:1374475-Amorphochlora_amoeboformis.AAC.1
MFSLTRSFAFPGLQRSFATLGKGRRVVVCLDEKEHQEVYDWAENNVLNADDQIHLFHAYEPIATAQLEELGVPASSDIAKGFDSVLEKNAEQIAAVVAEGFSKRGFQTKIATAAGNPAEQIRKYADKTNADLILVGKRGREVGPIASEVVNSVTKPVFVYPEKDPLAGSIYRRRKACKVRFHL